jgi:diguanylate cyclase (GGDEF)-like protein
MTDATPCSASERQLELIQRVGRIGYWEWQTGSGLAPLDERGARLLEDICGITSTAALSLPDVMSETERQHFTAALEQAVAKRLTLNIEIRIARPGHTDAYLLVHGTPLDADADGGGATFAGTFQDITRSRQVEIEREETITQLYALLGSMPTGVTLFDDDLRLLFWNEPIYEILGLPRSAVYRFARFEDLIRYPAMRGEYGPGDPEQLIRDRAEVARRFEAHSFERPGRDGRILQVDGYPFRFGGKVSGFVTTYTDITQRKITEDQLTRQNNVLTTIIDNFPGAISLFDADLRMAACNEQFKTLLELPDELMGRDVVMFEDLIRFNAKRGEYGNGDIEETVAAIVARARQFEAHKFERVRPSGLAVEVRGTPLPGGGFVTIYIDITERKRAEERIRLMALHDPLTKLPNRLNCNDQIEQALERANDKSQGFALMFLDLDGFKKVNDTWGHDIGDLLLIHVAACLKACVRETDIVARLAGDEFVILLHGIDTPERIGSIADEIVTSLSTPCTLNGNTVKVGTSIGIALFPEHGRTREELLKAADTAMYAAKSSGRGTWRVATRTSETDKAVKLP